MSGVVRSCQEVSGVVMGRQEVLGGVRSHQEVSRGVRRCREESGVVRSCQKVSGVCKITCLYEESNIMVFVAKAYSPNKEVSNFLLLLLLLC